MSTLLITIFLINLVFIAFNYAMMFPYLVAEFQEKHIPRNEANAIRITALILSLVGMLGTPLYLAHTSFFKFGLTLNYKFWILKDRFGQRKEKKSEGENRYISLWET